MSTVKLKFRPSLVPEAEGTLYYQVTYNRKVKWMTSGCHIYPDEWDGKEAEVVIPAGSRRKAELKLVQNKVNWGLSQWRNILNEADNANKEFSMDELLDFFRNAGIYKTVFMFLREQVMRKEWMRRQGTSIAYGNAYRRFREFRRGLDLAFDDLTPDMMERYEAWLVNRRLMRNTISFYLRTLNTLLCKAIDDGLLADKNLFCNVRLSYAKTQKRAISASELQAICRLQLPEGSMLSFARDIFMFSFYMRGMSFVDIAFLRKSDLKKGLLGYCRRKTNQYLTVAWEEEQREIVGRYEHLTLDTPYMLPVIRRIDGTEYRQYCRMRENVDRNLKKIGEMIGLKIPLTTYVARHTWASIARDMDISVSVISEGMGHNSLRTTQVYLNSIDMSRVNEANRKIISMINS